MISRSLEHLRHQSIYWRLAVYVAAIGGLIGWQSLGSAPVARGQAPTESLEDVSPSSGDSGTEKPAVETADSKVPNSLWDMYIASGAIGFIITLLSMIALGFVVEHFLTIRKTTLMPDYVVEELDNLLKQGQLEQAQAFCLEPQNASLFSHVVLAGIERYRGSEFGFAEYKAAVEEAGEEQTSRLYRKTEVLGVIGAVAPMLGLLGTVQGMILGFNMIATTGGAAKPEDLASSISLALVTTFEGLVVAIPAMVAFSFFRNRIDTLVAEAGKRVEQVLAPLGRRKA